MQFRIGGHRILCTVVRALLLAGFGGAACDSLLSGIWEVVMGPGRCPHRCGGCHAFSRRDFLKRSTVLLAGSSVIGGCSTLQSGKSVGEPIRPRGPASTCVPVIRAAFVRRNEPYGMRWPGAVYDGEAARQTYAAALAKTAAQVGAKLELRPEPIYSAAEGEAWIAEAEAAKADDA